MTETRYRKLAEYHPLTWNPTSHVEVIKGAILLDQIEGKILLQLKLCNISDKNISSVHIKVIGFDETGEEVSENNIVEFAFQDLNIGPRTTFGEQNPIFFADPRVRKVNILFSKVMFTDGEIRIIDESDAKMYPSQILLEDLGSELVTELERIVPETNSFEKKVMPQLYANGTWTCLCGRINDQRTNCVRCGRAIDWQLKKVNHEFLQNSLNEYKEKLREEKNEQERLRIEDEKLKADKEKQNKLTKAKKQRRIVWTASLIVVIGIIVYIGYKIVEPRIQFAMANQKLEEGNYEEAKELFKNLGDYKEAKNMVKESDYRQALNFRETGKFTESITAFYQLGDYRDSLEQEKESRLQLGNSFIENKEYDKAVAQLDPIKNYKEATENYTESLYQLSLVHLKKEKFNEAAANFEKLGDYKDSKNQLIESKYQIAANMKGSRKELEKAREIFKELGNYKDSAAKAENMSTALKWHGRWYKIRYDQWVGGTVEFDKTFGPFGKEPFYDYIDIDFYNNKMVSFSDIATLNFDLEISGNTLTTDFYGDKDKYVLKGNKLVFEELGHARKNRVTYVREDVKDQDKP